MPGSATARARRVGSRWRQSAEAYFNRKDAARVVRYQPCPACLGGRRGKTWRQVLGVQRRA